VPATVKECVSDDPERRVVALSAAWSLQPPDSFGAGAADADATRGTTAAARGATAALAMVATERKDGVRIEGPPEDGDTTDGRPLS
jgi:hypothetical protein